MKRFARSLPIVQAGVLATLALVVAGCETVQTTQPGVVGVQRQQYVSPLVNRAALNKQATVLYKETLGDAEKKQLLNRDPEAVSRVRAIAHRIIPQVGAFRPDARNWQWEINVISSKELNAWCMPGGKIAVYTGLIEQLQASDDELAQVMGHEIAHALREHAWERASRQAAAGLGMTIVGIALGVGQDGIDLASTVYNVTFQLPNSREHETEADRIGIELAARAGYDPRAAVTLWQKMAKASDGAPPKWLSTHPAAADREQDLRFYGEKVMPLYQQAKR
ncbi:M48 family metallopeptidase [Uliginosibacterium paludis]|uniref:M48 family metallopeptidase n=1 Tax=Uliginosibacterium paludis TaxID=1615952 RepID=A0ABV2CKQ1_9RHOO